MQYENVIVELLSRIKTLEDDVRLLKQWQSNFFDANLQVSSAREDDGSSDSRVSYRKMTDEMIELCYKYGKKVHEGENLQELADEIVNKTGMNRNSSIMYLYAVDSMLKGVIYKRAISAKAIQKYFDNILRAYGSEGLKKAIHATRLHIDYRKSCGHTADSLEELCDNNERGI